MEDLIVLYEDNHIIVVLKPQNIPTQADSSGDKDMLTLVKEYIKVKYNKPGNVFVGLVHRLDRPTGGVMVFAKTSKAASRLSEMIRLGDFDKKYLAVVCGKPRFDKDKLMNYLKKDETNNKVVIAPMSTAGAKYAELDYLLLETVQDFSLVYINLITGRSHQARVQLANIGTPIFGDQKYGAEKRTYKYNLALWAYELKFKHPINNETMVFRAYPDKEQSPWRAFDISRLLGLNIKDVLSSQ